MFNESKIGNTFANSNGKTYIIVYENKAENRYLLLDPQTHTYIGAWGLNWDSKDWWQGHYFMENFESAVNWVMRKEVN